LGLCWLSREGRRNYAEGHFWSPWDSCVCCRYPGDVKLRNAECIWLSLMDSGKGNNLLGSSNNNIIIPLRHLQPMDIQQSSASLSIARTVNMGNYASVSVKGGRSNESHENSLKRWRPVHSAIVSGRLLSVVFILSPRDINKTKPFYTYLLYLCHDRLMVGGVHRNQGFYGPRFIVYCRVLIFISLHIYQKIQ
jgi:hypothetical protein